MFWWLQCANLDVVSTYERISKSGFKEYQKIVPRPANSNYVTSNTILLKNRIEDKIKRIFSESTQSMAICKSLQS